MDYLAPQTWHNTKLKWTEEVLSKITPFYLVSLNPHWEIKKYEGHSFWVKDLLSDKEYNFEINIELFFQEFYFDFKNLLKIHGKCNEHNELEINYEPYITEEKLLQNFSYFILSIREYYRLYVQRGILNQIWIMLMNKVWLKMSPRQRRISHLILKATFLEVILIIALIVGYFYFER